MPVKRERVWKLRVLRIGVRVRVWKRRERGGDFRERLVHLGVRVLGVLRRLEIENLVMVNDCIEEIIDIFFFVFGDEICGILVLIWMMRTCT